MNAVRVDGMQLRLYMKESDRHRGQPVHAWLLQRARALGIPGGSAFRAIAGYGRHGNLHAQQFFELAGDEPVLVECIAPEPQIRALLDELRGEGLTVFYACLALQYGVTDAEGATSAQD